MTADTFKKISDDVAFWAVTQLIERYMRKFRFSYIYTLNPVNVRTRALLLLLFMVSGGAFAQIRIVQSADTLELQQGHSAALEDQEFFG